MFDHEVDNAAKVFPILLVHLAAEPAVEMRRVHHLSIDVQLKLRVGAVADTNRPRSPVAFELNQLELGQPSLAADAVHQLEVAGPAHCAPFQPVLKRFGFLAVAENEERVEREGGVAYPGVAIIPVAL